ncbi:MAG: hypothetical protein ACRD3D_16220 [Terriglobia bacterium]
MVVKENEVAISGGKGAGTCNLIIQKDADFASVCQFVTEGLQIGQQVAVMAGARFLRELAHGLSECGMRPDLSLRNGRLIFLTAPGCLPTLLKPDDPTHRGPLRTNAPLLRWVSDWTWAYGKGMEPARALEYQRRVHEFTGSLGALSLCTALGAQLDRNSLLALLADHRRSARAPEGLLRAGSAAFSAAAGQ